MSLDIIMYVLLFCNDTNRKPGLHAHILHQILCTDYKPIEIFLMGLDRKCKLRDGGYHITKIVVVVNEKCVHAHAELRRCSHQDAMLNCLFCIVTYFFEMRS